MGDEAIEEIYTLLEAALRAGQGAVPVHIFPFAMTDAHDARFDDATWGAFWRNLREGHDWFERHGVPPRVRVRGRQYVFSAP
jgi:murein L,D-transpeptidase YafK